MKRKRVKKRFFLFVLLVLAVLAVVSFPDKIGQALSFISIGEQPEKETPPPVNNTEPPASNTEPSTHPTEPPDTEPPVIEGELQNVVYIGEPVSFRKYVTVTDNVDKDVELEVDSSSVNLTKAGSYTVVYRAVDSSGNAAEKKVLFIVEEKPQQTIELEKVNEQADQILAEIIEEDMTPREKARAIYNWVRGHISYDGNYENNTDWVKGAFDGFQSRRGDCYVFFGVTKALLNRADLENLDIVKEGGGHYWSMVNLGEGWYHYDTTPRKTGGEFFMMTDAELKAYSDQYGNSHVWDRDKYPATPLE
ncbi:MAG: transglutaminase domain-containing protein [Caldicoprobacterales bacterium]